MAELAPGYDVPDFTTQISGRLESPIAFGSLSEVYRLTIKSNEGTMEVAVKVFKIDHRRAMGKIQHAMRRELKVWLRLSKHLTIVPLLGIAHIGSLLPALISQWMPSETLDIYLEKQGTITASDKVELAKGVADGLEYLHSENVVHGDLHPGNVLIDGSGHPCLTDFGLATVAGDVELQLNATTAARDLNPRWRAPEVVIGINLEGPVRPTIKSDVYSFGGVMFFIVSGVIPWKEKKSSSLIIIELSNRATPARPNNILDDHWNLIQQCWSWDPVGRPEATEVIRCIAPKITTVLGETEMAGSTIQTILPKMAANDIAVLQKNLGGEDISRPATPDMTTARWNETAQCWSSDVSARPSAIMAMNFLKSELEALTDDDMSVDEVVESYRSTSFDAEQTTTSSNVMDPTRPISEAVQREIGLRTRDHRASASVNTVTLHPSQGGSLSRTAARSDSILQGDSIQQNAGNPKRNTKVHERRGTGQSRNDASQAPIPNSSSLPIVDLLEDLTDQIHGTINDYVAGGTFGNVYKCEWRRPSGPVKVAVKSFMYHTSDQDLRRFRREAEIWAHFVHDNIVPLYGTTEGFGPTTALVSPWFPDGTLLHLITEQGATLTIRSKLKLLHGIASGLYYLHSFPVVHGDITSSNVLVDIQGGEYKACLTDFGVSNVLGGRFKDRVVEGSTVRPGAIIIWTAPELLRPHGNPADLKLTTQNDMYSYGRVMFHLLTLIIPWYDIDEYQVVQKILSGEEIPRPEISAGTRYDITDARWNQIKQCWSVDPSARPSALMAMDFLKSELEAVTNDYVFVGEAHEHHHIPSLDVVNTEQIFASGPLKREADILTAWPHQSSSGILVVPQNQAATYNPTIHQASTVSSLSLSGPLNVLLFGETGVGKSSIINLIMRQEVAQTSPDAESGYLKHTSYEISLGILRFKLWEVPSIESMGLSRAYFYKQRLKKAFRKLHRDDGVYLLLYCMKGSRVQREMIKDYKMFTDIISSAAGAQDVPVAAVVTGLEDYPMDMDNWWTKNKDNLDSLGMRFSKHACITSLPDDPNASLKMRARRNRSEQAIRSLIDESYQTGRTPLNYCLALAP